MNPLVKAGAGEAEEVRRPLSVSKRFYNFLQGVLVTLYTLLLKPVFELVAFLIPRGVRRLLFGPLMQWRPIYGSERVPSGTRGRVKSKNLVTQCLIGKGSSGIFYETTWLGWSQGSSSRLARKDFPGVKGEIFEREVIPLFELPDHPNLLKTLCWTVDRRSCSLVMEYMRDDLSSVVRRRKEELRKKQANQSGMDQMAAPFELHETLEIVIQIATGMEYLHLNGITHGDLKASNIFIDWKETDKILVKVADFGLLQTKRRSTMVSQRAFCFQMMEWSAPELFEDYFRSTSEDLEYLWTKSPIGLETSTSSVSTFEKSTEVSITQADSYSFALLCAFVLGGQMWNAELSPSELRREISHSGLRPTLPSECPKTLRSLISLCWDANPTRRPTFSYILKSLREEQRDLQKGDLSSLKPILVAEEPLPSRESFPSVLIRRENRDAFNDFHEDLDTDMPPLLMDNLGATSERLTSAKLKNLEEEKLVVSENRIAGTSHDLPSYLNIDLTTVRYLNPVRSNMRTSQHDPVDGSALFDFVNWHGCDYALKVFKAVDRSEYFMDVEALTKLQHPNIVQLVGFGQDEEKLLALMELMDTDLRSFMHRSIRQRDRPFSLAQELDIITQIAKGLHYLHEQQFSHGDLSCSKILVKQMDDHIDVKLTDFRLSEKLGTWDPVSFKERRRHKRLRWSAPEIYSYGDVEPTHALLKKADVYSFGMVCYEVVTGKYPFHGLRGDALLEQIATGVLRQDLPSELDGDLRLLIESCWERDPNARPTLDKICLMLYSISSLPPVTSTRPENAIALRPFNRISIYKYQSLSWTPFGFINYQLQDAGLYKEYSNAVPWPDCVEINPANLQLLWEIGAGSSADVYVGTWLWSNVAVKIYKNTAKYRLIQNELNFYIKLRHPSIVQFMGISFHSKGHGHINAVVMELMGGDLRNLIECCRRQKSEAREPVLGLDEQKTTVGSGNLQELLDLLERNKVSRPETVHVMPFDLREAVYIMRRIALGVAFMHSKGVAHRDLKSTNILVPTHAGSIDVKIADFGLSQHINSRKEPFRSVGSGFWMAPELFPWKNKVKFVEDDEPCDLKAADVYSFAMTCYEVLTGQVPFEDQEGWTKKQLKLAVSKGLRPTLPSAELMSADLRRLIEQCWDKQPEKRPTFSYICTELQRIQQSLTTEKNLDDGVHKH